MGRWPFSLTFLIPYSLCPFCSRKSKSFLCKCSFIEIYNEQIYDLLDSASATLFLRENIKKGVFVEGAVEKFVTSASEAYQVGILKRTSGFPGSSRDIPALSSRSSAALRPRCCPWAGVTAVWPPRP